MVHGYVPPAKAIGPRPRGRVSLVEDDTDVSVPAESPSEGPPAKLDSTKAHGPDWDFVAPAVAAFMALTPSVQAAAVAADIPHDPLVHPEAADVVEEAVDDA
ncbi:hypothetical protein V6N13_053486 [Hibiscus sabdariffa]|uniref:Uncharacterized protein n=1 Tax=Hibiscus sabdariffa TaxID=183260 RepID=A0ABR2T7R4_9ROSI